VQRIADFALLPEYLAELLVKFGVLNMAAITHPDCSAYWRMVDPLFACGGKRVGISLLLPEYLL